jgi:hypothetical protein
MQAAALYPQGRLRTLQVLVITLLYSTVMLTLINAGHCRPCDPRAPSHCNPGLAKNALANFKCPPGHYNDLAALVVSPNGVRPSCSTLLPSFSTLDPPPRCLSTVDLPPRCRREQGCRSHDAL